VPATRGAEFCLVRKKTATLYRGDRARRSRPGARQPLVRSEGAAAGPPSSPSENPIWSVAISTRSMAFLGSAPPTVAGALVSAEPSTAPPSPDLPRGTLPVPDPKRTAKPDQRHRQGKREIIGLMAVACYGPPRSYLTGWTTVSSLNFLSIGGRYSRSWVNSPSPTAISE
jgi:hypothetical protein